VTSIAKAERAEDEVISKISSFYQRSPEEVSEDDKLLLLQLQYKLDDLYRQKAEGAFVRTRKCDGVLKDTNLKSIPYIGQI